ncbi:hypothetical protein ACFUJU_19395 [Streptomyces sp. NPDC057235]|uniref:hypothetical protein n=1 Tax=Streptomyces sp. NPDC057235 TaxID=3346058 RepID=UPI00364035AA
MRRSREETAPQDLPGELWHALARLQHTHPDPMGRVGPLARPAGLLPFTAAADTVLAARVQLTGAESMREVNETLRAMTGDLPRAHFTGSGVALELTSADARTSRSTRCTSPDSPGSSGTPPAPLVPAALRAAAGASTATERDVLGPCGSRWLARLS